MNSYFDDFRVNLKYYREKCSFSQFDLAVQADCSNALVGNIEAGRVKPSFETIVKFAEALKIHPADLFLRETSKSKVEIRKELKETIEKVIDKVVLN